MSALLLLFVFATGAVIYTHTSLGVSCYLFLVGRVEPELAVCFLFVDEVDSVSTLPSSFDD